MHRVSVLFQVVVILAALTVVGGSASVAAQDATPAPTDSPLAAMGYPELTIRASAAGFEVPADVAAGRTLVTFENVDLEDVNGFLLIKIGGDVQLADLQPAAEDEGAPAAWFYKATMIGSSIAVPDQRSQILADLTPGEWVVVGYFDLNRVSQPFTVTGEVRAMGEEPTAEVTVTEQDFAFVGLGGTLPAGQRVWKVTNTGLEPHAMALMRAPKALTQEQWLALWTLPEDATPPPDLGVSLTDLEQMEIVDGVAALSASQTVWIAIDLAPGDYVAICFLSSPDGMAHAAMGMIQPFTVA